MTQRLTPETLIYGLKSAGDPQLSPDGDWVVYTLSSVSPDTNKETTHLWLQGREDGHAQQLTNHYDSNSGPCWSPDGRWLAFVASDGDRSGIMLLPFGQPGEPRPLTWHNQGISDLAWSPDGRRIAYLTAFDPENPDEAKRPDGEPPPVRVTSRIDYKWDGRGYIGDKRWHVFVVDIENGERRRLTTAAHDHGGPGWSPDGRWIATGLTDLGRMNATVLLIDSTSGQSRPVSPELGGWPSHAWSPSGKRLLVVASLPLGRQEEYFVYDLDSGGYRQLTNDLGWSPVSVPVWLDEKRLLVHGQQAGASKLWELEIATGETKQIAGWQALHTGLSVDRAKRYAAQKMTDFQHYGEIALIDLSTGERRLITDLNGDVFREYPPAGWEHLTLERDGFTIDGWLLKPSDFDPGKRYPLVLSVHGGPYSHYGFEYQFAQQLLAGNGFLVLSTNPRGSSTYGAAFAKAVIGDYGGGEFQDHLAMIDLVSQRPYVDAERLGIRGYSHGGFMVAWAITQTDRFKAAVCGAPTFDQATEWGRCDEGTAFGDEDLGGSPYDVPEVYRRTSPSTYAANVKTPTLIYCGEEDERCPIGESEQMFTTLKRFGCEVEFVRYPGVSHGFASSGPVPYRVDALRRNLDWLMRYLGEPA